MIETHHLSKLYSRGVYALRDLSLSVDKGEFMFLTGPSGAGKTTTLKAISNLLRAERGDVTKGTIEFEGAIPEKDFLSAVLQAVALARHKALPVRVLSQGQRRRIGDRAARRRRKEPWLLEGPPQESGRPFRRGHRSRRPACTNVHLLGRKGE